jgi:hypothetical protein
MIACIQIMRNAGAEVKSAPAIFSILRKKQSRRGSFIKRRYELSRSAVGLAMNTFSDLPRFPTASVDHPDETPDTATSIRSTLTIAQVTGELLALAVPIVALLWWIVFFPLMFGLLLFAASQHDRR